MGHANKRSRDGDGDFFSNLPECLVTEILFRLPTKDAVRTSILSKVWQHRWTYARNVFIENLPPWNCPQKKLSFINRSSFQAWVSVITRHKNLERFEISIVADGTVYPSCLLHSTSLRKLVIKNINSTMCVAGFNCAPRLTSIYLYEVKIVNDNPNSSTVKFDFPVLENIKLVAVKWVNVKSVEIRAPFLTTFVSGLVFEGNWDNEFLITLVSPKLTTFVCTYGMPEVFIANGPSVESAFLDYGDCEIENLERIETIQLRVNKMVNGFTSLKELDLSPFAVQALLLGPGFHGNKVTTLRLYFWSSAEQLLALLHIMPSLKFLVVNVFGVENYDYEAMESVPSCIASQLEEVVFRFFNAEVPQYHLARFFSKSASQLKKLTLITDNISTELISTIGPLLSTFTRCSEVLEIDAQQGVGLSELGDFKQFL